MAKALGIGGVFFRSRDTKALAAWYETHLGVSELFPQQAGLAVFAPFKQDTTYFPPDKQWMINFRVDDLDEIVDQLRSAGETVDVDPERYPNGRFAELRDLEGNGIQLWQPMSPA
jgi:predicted enzyme related to lactoylglutathione lyase